jgi:predicted dehydrogenase
MNKILIVGYGSIGKRHVNNLLSIPNTEIIIYPKQKNLKFLNKKIKIYNKLNESLKEKPDIAFVTNETSKHIPIAIKLAKKKMDLFLEKPLSNSMINVKTLVSTAKKNNLITQIGCNFRFHPCLIKMKKIIDNGTIGKIIVAQVESGSYLPDWHPYEDYRSGYAARKDLGGGIVLTCIHEMDYLYWFFGDVKEVFSITGKFSDLEVTSDDMSSSILRFKNDIIAEVHLDYFQKPDFKSCKIKGTKGTLYWDSDHNEVKIYLTKNNKWKTVMKLNNFERNQTFVDEIKHFLKCVKTKKPTINDINQGVRTLEIALAMKKSSKIKKMVRI